MSLLMLGISHRTATLPLLERVALPAEKVSALTQSVLAGSAVTEALVVGTCNRLEIYAEVTAFHPSLVQIGEAFAQTTGVPLPELAEHLTVHYADRVASHLFEVACGLDSMAIGEGQILGQLRRALRGAQEAGQAGPVLEQLLQRALRVGKKAHSETDLDRVGGSLLAAGLARASGELGPISEQRVLILGAGSMSALAAATVRRAGPAQLVIANRTLARAEHLAQAVTAEVLPWSQLEAGIARADLVIACTGAVGHVISAAQVASAHRARAARPQHFVDLALPRDLDPAIAKLPGVSLTDLADLGADLAVPENSDLEQVRALVHTEVAEYLMAVRVQAVAPTVAALRDRAAEVVCAELERLDQRLPQADPAVLAELQRTVHRVVEKILHVPTVRVKELATRTDGAAYAGALRELFDLPSEPLATVAPELPRTTDLAALLSGQPSSGQPTSRPTAGV